MSRVREFDLKAKNYDIAEELDDFLSCEGLGDSVAHERGGLYVVFYPDVVCIAHYAEAKQITVTISQQTGEPTLLRMGSVSLLFMPGNEFTRNLYGFDDIPKEGMWNLPVDLKTRTVLEDRELSRRLIFSGQSKCEPEYLVDFSQRASLDEIGERLQGFPSKTGKKITPIFPRLDFSSAAQAVVESCPTAKIRPETWRKLCPNKAFNAA